MAEALLDSSDARQKLEAYAALSAECCASKAQQSRVGSKLRERPAIATQRRLLDVAFSDLKATNRTTRLSATRLICQAAYESLQNQESIAELANGFAVGWVHIFAVPQCFQAQYAADCAAGGRTPSARGLKEFLTAVVANNYALVYRHVSSYYGGGCCAFLPLTWQYPPPPTAALASQQHDGLDSTAVPDPACHLVGFYRVPRQAQLPEQDDFYSDALLGAMDAGDVDRIQRVHRAFVAAAVPPKGEDVGAGGQGKARKSTLLRALQSDEQLWWVLEDYDGRESTGDADQTVESVCRYFDRREEGSRAATAATTSTESDDPSALVWSQVLVYCCMQINTQRLRAAFGAETLAILVDMFRGLALSSVSASLPAESEAATSLLQRPRVHSGLYVWEAALVGAILDHSKLPGALKLHAASFQRGLYQSDPRRVVVAASSKFANDDDHHYLREPWRHLLPFRLEQIHPVSWCLFLTQWRVAADAFRSLESPQRRMTTVCSVSTIRQSMISIDSRSFFDLENLRQELPNVARSERLVDAGATGLGAESAARRRISEDREAESEETRSDAASRSPSSLLRSAARRSNAEHGASDESTLAHYLRLFHRMQSSPSEMDKLGALQLQEKQAALAKLHETVSINKKRLANEAKRRCVAFEGRLRDEDEKREELEQKKADARLLVQRQHLTRHDSALRRRQQQQARDDAKQQALAAQIELEQLEHRKLVEAKRWQQPAKKRAPAEEEELATLSAQATAAAPAIAAGAPSRRPGSARRPFSGRAPSAHPPEILRQRAQIYGDVVSKIYLAEAARQPQHRPLAAAPPHLARRFTCFRQQSALRGGTEGDSVDPRQQQPSLSAGASGKLERKQYSGASSGSHVLAREHASGLKEHAVSSACTTLVMRNAALVISERIDIPAVPSPALVDSREPAYAIETQYSTLPTRHKLKFRERFNLKGLSHRLSYTVLKQFTKIVRRDTAWDEFHAAAAKASGDRTSDRIRHADFVLVAQQLGIAASAKKLLAVARRLDDKKNGFVDWESFYAWWSAQYDDHQATSRSQ